jgi:hypothetical protein
MSSGSGPGRGTEMTLNDLESYKNVLEQTARLSELVQRNFTTIHSVLEKINSIQGITPEKIAQLKDLANSITQASNSLGDEKTVMGLKHLESIVKR